jgi:uncharacterized protein YndB with AHSA1/START domain
MTQTIERRLEFAAPPERVWRAITDPDEIAHWFGDRAELDLRPGGAGAFSWDNHGDFAVRVELVEPPYRLSWRWAQKPGTAIEEGVSTLVEWVLMRRADGGTILELRESGFVEQGHYEGNTTGWTAELGELEALLARE